MKHRARIQLMTWTCLCLCGGIVLLAHAQEKSATQGNSTKEKVVAGHASGTFEVKLTPQTAEDGADSGLGRMSIDKQFHGDIEGTSKGFMLSSAATIVKGSGGYVAMERVTGKLKDRTGSFVLQHSGTMTRGTPQMTIAVVPDSGTEQLVGLVGMMTIKIDAGKHSYEFDYTVPATP
jgi:hypothetical protein